MLLFIINNELNFLFFKFRWQTFPSRVENWWKIWKGFFEYIITQFIFFMKAKNLNPIEHLNENIYFFFCLKPLFFIFSFSSHVYKKKIAKSPIRCGRQIQTSTFVTEMKVRIIKKKVYYKVLKGWVGCFVRGWHFEQRLKIYVDSIETALCLTYYILCIYPIGKGRPKEESKLSTGNQKFSQLSVHFCFDKLNWSNLCEKWTRGK